MLAADLTKDTMIIMLDEVNAKQNILAHFTRAMLEVVEADQKQMEAKLEDFRQPLKQPSSQHAIDKVLAKIKAKVTKNKVELRRIEISLLLLTERV